MSKFLDQWDSMIYMAKASGQSTVKWSFHKFDENDPHGPGSIFHPEHYYISARTMHPSFMADRPAKFDPERDQ